MERQVIFQHMDNPGVPGQQEFCNQSQRYLLVTDEPPSYRRATVVLSKTIKLYIQRYLSISRNPGFAYGPIGSPEWTQALCQFLQTHDTRVTLEDVERWKRNHPWITTAGLGNQANPGNISSSEVSTSTRTRSGTRPSESNASTSPSPPSLPSSQASTILMSQASPRNLSKSDPGNGGGNPRSEKRKLDKCMDLLLELRETCLDQPDLRAAVAHLDPLANLFSRRIKNAVTKRSRVEKVQEDLEKDGVPQFVRGYKKESVIVNMGHHPGNSSYGYEDEVEVLYDEVIE